ncbi:alanine racemase [Frisingicoccus sp.]|uniref:alanine racemase n=1 Tax=Frisingicoccus sp. TaxID=1918627 RepID=UPI003999E193
MNKSEMGSIYRVCAGIDLDALKYNVDGIKRCKAESAMLMGVIKADAYGHGAKVFAHELDRMGFDWFAVATADEGIELRRDGIEQPILVLGYSCEAQYPDMVQWEITPTIYSLDMAKAFDAAAEKAGKVANIHIKIDTGMSRIGFLPGEESLDEIEKIHGLRHLRIQGMFTHFACADMRDKTHVGHQIEKFRQMIDGVRQRGIPVEIFHCSNSASIMELPSEHMNLVRAGIILYGLYPSHEMEEERLPLKPVMSLYSHVVHVKEVPEGVTVGYGATYVTRRPTRIGTIPVGYADGYPRILSNRASVLIRGRRAPIIGRVCMDQFMVDVTDMPEVSVGDVVTLIGRDGEETLSVEEISEMAGSFNYEFVCDVSRRVPRVYIKNGKPVSVVNYLR